MNSILHSAGGLKQLPLRRVHVTPEVTLITSGGLRRLDVYASFGIRVSFCLGVFIVGDDAGHVFDVQQRIRLVLGEEVEHFRGDLRNWFVRFQRGFCDEGGFFVPDFRQQRGHDADGIVHVARADVFVRGDTIDALFAQDF